MSRLKEAFEDAIEEQFTKVIAPQQDRLDIPSTDVVEDSDFEDGYPF